MLAETVADVDFANDAGCVSGFAQFSLRGKGLAAGFCIVLLGVMLDRITRYAANIRETQGA